MTRRIDIDAATVRSRVDALLTEFPELGNDEALRLDMLEGETDLNAVCGRVLAEKLDAEAMVAAIKMRAADLADRGNRFGRKADAMKALLRSLLEAAQVKTLPLPDATLSLSQGRPSVEVIIPEDLPQGFFITEIRPDKRALLASLTAGEQVPGARLVPGKIGLTVRPK